MSTKKPKTRPKPAMAAAFEQAHAELVVSRLMAMSGGDIRALPSSALTRISTRLFGAQPTPGQSVEDILSESRRRGVRPSTIASSKARKAAAK